MQRRIQRAKLADKIATGIFVAIAVLFFLLLFGFAGKVIIGGFLGAKPEMFRFAMSGAIGNQLFNTIYLVFISLLVSCPIGVFAGIYLAMYAKKGRLTKIIRICIETLSSLPSIVVGLFGYLVFLVALGMGKSLLAGALLLQQVHCHYSVLQRPCLFKSGTYRLMDKIQTWPTLLRPCYLYWYWPSALVLMLYQDIFKQKTRVKGDKYVEY